GNIRSGSRGPSGRANANARVCGPAAYWDWTSTSLEFVSLPGEERLGVYVSRPPVAAGAKRKHGNHLPQGARGTIHRLYFRSFKAPSNLSCSEERCRAVV